MLTHIHIRDFTIIDSLELDLQTGMTVLTGETGAGKSILVDALAFALGDRADVSLIRHDQERAEVAAAFDITGTEPAGAWLKEQGMEDEDGTCLIRRVLGRDGRSKAFVNGHPVPVNALRTLGEWLVDIHGQHEHQSLLRRDAQRQLLDEYASHKALLEALNTCYRRWKSLNADLDDLSHQGQDREARLELVRYQARELDALSLNAGEWTGLDEEHKRLSHASHLLETCRRAIEILHENEEASVATMMSRITHDIKDLQRYDQHLAGPAQLLETAHIQLREAVDELRRYVDALDIDPERLQWVEDRIAALHDMARKHHVAPEELVALQTRLKDELAVLEGAGVNLERLQTELKKAADDYRALAKKLGAGRAKAAKTLSEKVTARMQELGMAGGRFAAGLMPREPEQFSAAGLEDIEFQVSANPGMPLKPLARVASGGELSRISLAIQVITAGGTHVPTLVFDEVDVGIGGGVAEIVGTLLRQLGETRQVLCVTHLPQVAALGHQHVQVSKKTNGGTRTTLQSLTDKDRHEEIARMLGGIEITEQTRAHAKEMVTRAQKTNR